MGTAPATMGAGKAVDAFGCLPGHRCQQADAEQDTAETKAALDREEKALAELAVAKAALTAEADKQGRTVEERDAAVARAAEAEAAATKAAGEVEALRDEAAVSKELRKAREELPATGGGSKNRRGLGKGDSGKADAAAAMK